MPSSPVAPQAVTRDQQCQVQRKFRIAQSKIYEEGLLEIEAACLLAIQKKGVDLGSLNMWSIQNPLSTVYRTPPLQLLLLNRLKYLVALLQRKCYENDGPNYLGVILHPVASAEITPLDKVLRYSLESLMITSLLSLKHNPDLTCPENLSEESSSSSSSTTELDYDMEDAQPQDSD